MTRALVLSGGGGLGAYQVGALSYILGDLEIQHDIVVGTSVGAINGLGVSMFPVGEEKQAAFFLVNQWEHLETKDIISPNNLQPLSLLWKPSMHKVDPLRRLLKAQIESSTLHRSFACVSVDIITGQLKVWTDKDNNETLLDGIVSSSMVPVIHPSVHKDNMILYDGGLVEVTPVRQAIEMGATEVDILLTQSVDLGPWTLKSDRLWNTVPRVFEIMFRELVEGDLRTLQLYNALSLARDLADELGDDSRAAKLKDQLKEMNLVNKRVVKVRILRPTKPLPMDSTKFDPNEIRAVMKIGREEAQKVDWGVAQSMGGSW